MSEVDWNSDEADRGCESETSLETVFQGSVYIKRYVKIVRSLTGMVGIFGSHLIRVIQHPEEVTWIMYHENQ